MSSNFRAILMVMIAVLGLSALSARAQNFTALARVDPTRSFLRDAGTGIALDLALTQAVPYRVYALNDPARLVMDFREVNWDGLETDDFLTGQNVASVRFGLFRPGWSRLVLELTGYQQVNAAGMKTDVTSGEAVIQLRTSAITKDAFAASAGAPVDTRWGLPEIARVDRPIRRQTGDRALVIVLDPGHGGIDPGAERGGGKEADLMLSFARELKESLLRAGGFEVRLTRNEDTFVPLEARVSIARAAGADVFLSLHADALAEGRATGASVYTLSETASDEASAKLAERHDRADLLAGVDLSAQDDVIAGVLMDMARIETAPRSDRLASALITAITQSVGEMYKSPRHSAGFSVLKAPDIPSVLLELGFLSNPDDLANIQSSQWRENMIRGIIAALKSWAISDAAEAQLLRQ